MPATPSEPPEVKQSRIHSDAVVDMFTIACLTILLVARACPPGWEPAGFFGIIGIGGGAQLLQLLGKRGGVVVGVVGLLPVLLKMLAAHRAVMLLPLAFMLAGCGAQIDPRTAIDATAQGVNGLQPAVVLFCEAKPGPECDGARQAYEAAAAAVVAAYDSYDAALATGEGLAAAEAAGRQAYDAWQEVGRRVAAR